MDKKEFCEKSADKLREFERYFQLQRAVSPATAQKANQLEQRRPRREEARARFEALRGRLNAVCADTAPLSDAVHQEIEQDFAAVRKLMS